MNIEVPFLFLVSLHFHCNLTKCRLGEYDMIFHKIFIKIKYKLNTGSGSATTHHSPPPLLGVLIPLLCSFIFCLGVILEGLFT